MDKVELFNRNYDLVNRVYASKYAYRDRNQHKEDILQEGAKGLWLAILNGRVIREDGTIDEAKAFRSIHSYMGAYIRNKIGHDPRVKYRKNIKVFSLNDKVEGAEGEVAEYIDFLEEFKTVEGVVLDAYTYKNFFDFFKKIDNECNLRSKYYDIIKLRNEGLTTTEISKIVGINQSHVSKRLKQAYHLYKDAYLRGAE